MSSGEQANIHTSSQLPIIDETKEDTEDTEEIISPLPFPDDEDVLSPNNDEIESSSSSHNNQVEQENTNSDDEENNKYDNETFEVDYIDNFVPMLQKIREETATIVVFK